MVWLKEKIKWILSPDHRYYIFTVLSFCLLFLYQHIGWSPILILWIINACLGYQEQKSSKIRFVHLAVGIVLALLVVTNIVMRILGKKIALF